MMMVVNTNIVVRFTPKAASKKAGLKNIREVLGKSCSNNYSGKSAPYFGYYIKNDIIIKHTKIALSDNTLHSN